MKIHHGKMNPSQLQPLDFSIFSPPSKLESGQTTLVSFQQIRHGSSSKLIRFFLAPFRWMGASFLRIYHFLKALFSCCSLSKNSVDWDEIGDISDEMRTQVRTSGEGSSERQKKFNVQFAKLSHFPEGKKEFLKHLGMAIAEKQELIKEPAKQLEWFVNNQNTYPFHEYFNFEDSKKYQVLQQAVENFDKAISKYTG